MSEGTGGGVEGADGGHGPGGDEGWVLSSEGEFFEPPAPEQGVGASGVVFFSAQNPALKAEDPADWIEAINAAYHRGRNIPIFNFFVGADGTVHNGLGWRLPFYDSKFVVKPGEILSGQSAYTVMFLGSEDEFTPEAQDSCRFILDKAQSYHGSMRAVYSYQHLESGYGVGAPPPWVGLGAWVASGCQSREDVAEFDPEADAVRTFMTWGMRDLGRLARGRLVPRRGELKADLVARMVEAGVRPHMAPLDSLSVERFKERQAAAYAAERNRVREQERAKRRERMAEKGPEKGTEKGTEGESGT